MPKVSAKRQITLPVDQCKIAGIGPGDDYNSYVDNQGRITIVKMQAGAAKGMLKHVKADMRFSDHESMQSAMGG